MIDIKVPDDLPTDPAEIYKRGFRDGEKKGHDNGYNDGHLDGYHKGWTDRAAGGGDTPPPDAGKPPAKS